jgi:predicted transcriptional regulator
MNADDIIIDPEFEALLPYGDKTEDSLLEQSVVDSNGPTDPLVLWGDSNILIDGHRRLKICKLHGLPFKTINEPLATREAVKVWMLTKQLSRRNLRDTSKHRLVRELYDRIRSEREGRDGNAADKIAEVMGTTRRTVYRHLETQRKIETLIPDWQVQAERSSIPKTLISELSKHSPEDQQILIDECISDGQLNHYMVVGKLRESLGIKVKKTHNPPLTVFAGEDDQKPVRNKPGRATKKQIAAKIEECRKSFAQTKKLAEELTGKYYLDSGIMRERMLVSMSKLQQCLKFLADNAYKRPGIK